MTEKETIKAILDHYGQLCQLNKTVEESGELQQASVTLFYLIRNYQGNDKNELVTRAIDHLAEEIADTQIMCEQMMFSFDLEKRVEEWKSFKLDRQMKRIAKEKEDVRS